MTQWPTSTLESRIKELSKVSQLGRAAPAAPRDSALLSHASRTACRTTWDLEIGLSLTHSFRGQSEGLTGWHTGTSFESHQCRSCAQMLLLVCPASRSEQRVPASLNGDYSSACQWWTGGLRIVADKTNGSRWPYEDFRFGRGRVSVIVQVTEKEWLLLSEKKLHLQVSKCSLLAIQRKNLW